jgi:anti-sigma regulatory factor (Ser/Thr protein kinase)
MPYFRCARCDLTVYSAAAWSTVDTCPSCCAPLRSAVGAAGEGPRSVHRRLAAGLDAPTAARAAVAPFKQGLDEDQEYVLMLLVTELVSNSVKHGPPGTVLVEAIDSNGCVHVEVTDAGDGFDATPGLPGPDVPSGRGLYIVDNLASRWGVDEDHPTRVWFEVDRAAASAPGDAVVAQ